MVKKKGDFILPFSRQSTAAGAHKDILVGKVDGVILFQFAKIAFDHAALIVDDHGEIVAAKIAEAVHNQLSDGLLPYRDQRFGQNFGVGVQPGAQTSCHHNDGDVGAFAVVHILAPGKDDVGDDAALVEDGRRVDASAFAAFSRALPRSDTGRLRGW